MGAIFYGTFDRRVPNRVQKRHADIIDISRIVQRSPKVSTRGLTKVTLVDIMCADFRRSERTIWEDYIAQERRAGYRWKDNQTVLFINNSGTMCIWIMAESRLNNAVVLDSRKWRLTGSCGDGWLDTENITYYASQVGFCLTLPEEDFIDKHLKMINHPVIEKRGSRQR